jgi:hypothetical protein
MKSAELHRDVAAGMLATQNDVTAARDCIPGRAGAALARRAGEEVP